MFAFDITKGILASLAIVAIVGSLGHYFIHKADFIKNKVWAFGLQWSLYLALILSTIIHLRFFPGDLGNARTICAWTCAGHTIIYASAVFALFSGGFFFHNFLLWVAVLACFVGVFVTTIYEGIESTRTRLENADSFVYWSIMLTTLLVVSDSEHACVRACVRFLATDKYELHFEFRFRISCTASSFS